MAEMGLITDELRLSGSRRWLSGTLIPMSASGRLLIVPFPDEKFSQDGVEVVDYRTGWATEGAEMTATRARLLPRAMATDHIGWTAYPVW